MISPAGADLTEPYAYCEAELREHDRDRWLASLFVPASARPHFHALYAFNLELSRVRDIVSDPMPGELRFQWWSDTIETETADSVAGHPIATALLDTVERFALPKEALQNAIEARRFDLYDDPMPSLVDLEGYCGETASALMRLASLVLADGGDPGGAAVAGHAGVAYALMGLLRALPWHAARGQVYLPADMLARHAVSRDDIVAGRTGAGLAAVLAELRALARGHLNAALAGRADAAPAARAALLPVVLVEPYLRCMEQRGYDAFKTPVELPQWRRQWALWRGARILAG